MSDTPSPPAGDAGRWLAPGSRRERTVLALMGVGLFTLYMVNGARFQGADTLGAPYTALSLLRDGDFYIDELVKDQRGYWFERGKHGVVSVYGFGPPLAAMPVYEVFDAVVWRGHWTENRLLVVGKVAGALMTALTAVLLAITTRRFAPFGAALAVGLVFALCSPAWSVTSQALWKHSPAVFLISAGLAMSVWPADARPPPLLVALSALPLAFSVWCRENLALVVLAAAIYIFWLRGKKVASLFAVLAGVVAAGFVTLNVMHFGAPLHSATVAHGAAVVRQQGAGLWDTPLWLGVYGLFLSPSRGLLVYAPIFLASFWGAWLGIRNGERPTWIFLTVAAVLTIAPSLKWHFWWGGASYGPRLMVDAVPFLVLLMVPIWPRTGASHLVAAPVVALALFSALVQGIGAFKYDGRAWDEPSNAPSVDASPDRLLRWSDSQLLFYLRWPATSPDRIPWR
jgi:hypothetical protein